MSETGSLTISIDGVLLNGEALQAIANKVCKHCPPGVQISLHMENGSAWVEASQNWKRNIDLPDSADKTLLMQLKDAVCAVNGGMSSFDINIEQEI